MYGLDTGFTTFPAFGHALCGFKPVNVIGIHATIADTDTFLELGIPWDVQRRDAPGYRKGRSRKKGEMKSFGILYHFHAFMPLGGEVLVIENGDGTSAGFKDLDHLLEEAVTWITFLTLVVAGVVPVFSNDDHAIHIQGIPAAGQCISDCFVDGNPVSLLAVTGKVVFGELIDIKGNQLDAWKVVFSVPPIPLQESINEMLSMAVAPYLGGQQRDTGWSIGIGMPKPERR